MRKNLAGGLLLVVMAGGLALAAFCLVQFGIGGSLSTLGGILLGSSVLFFVFFLSIDPGYGWAKAINLNTSYLMITASLVICFAGIMLIMVGRGINEIQAQTANAENRCQAIRVGEAEEVVAKDWYFLADEKSFESLKISLFQQRGNTGKYKVVVAADPTSPDCAVGDVKITSSLLATPLVMYNDECLCRGVFEQDVVIDTAKKQQLGSNAQFDIIVSYSDKAIEGRPRRSSMEYLRCSLRERPVDAGLRPEEEVEGVQVLSISTPPGL